jgi:uncharacterized protein YegL
MKDFTLIRMLVDRSGSMDRVRQATVTGINEFITMQKNAPGDGHIKVVQFDEDERGNFSYETVLDKHLSEAATISLDDFTPRGMTPLFDAMARTIDELGAELAALPEEERPNRVVVCIVTDGEENASKTYSRLSGGAARVKAMVQHQTTKYNWQFTYVGANQDAILVGESIGIAAAASMSFFATDTNTKSAFRSLSAYTSRLRGVSPQAMNKVAYTVEERAAATDEEDDQPGLTK